MGKMEELLGFKRLRDNGRIVWALSGIILAAIVV